MNRPTPILIAGGILTLGIAFSRAAAAHPDLTPVYIMLANSVSAPAPVIAGARVEAPRIYKAIGVQVIWTDQTPSAGGRHLFVSIVSEKMGTWLKAPLSALGTAFVGDSEAYVMFERVERFARTSRTWGHGSSVTLGLTIAHETGHLLLNSASHAAAGLMSATWSRPEAQLAASGNLLFTPREAELIREVLAPPRVAHHVESIVRARVPPF